MNNLDFSEVENWEQYCELLEGAEACIQGLPIPEDASEFFRFGFSQQYAEEQAA